MIRKIISAAAAVLLLASLTGCGADWGNGLVKEYEDNKEGIHQEFRELWDGFLEEIHDWPESFTRHCITEAYDLIESWESDVDHYFGTDQRGIDSE